MRLVWLLLAAGVVLGVDVQPCPAQVEASATIKAKVQRAPRSPRRGRKAVTAVQSQTALLTVDGAGTRAQLGSPTGEPITLEFDGNTTTTRVSLLVSDPAIPSGSAVLECRARLDGGTPAQDAQRPTQPTCEELVIRWPDSPDWPARLSISSAVRPDSLHGGRFVTQFTIVAEY